MERFYDSNDVLVINAQVHNSMEQKCLDSDEAALICSCDVTLAQSNQILPEQTRVKTAFCNLQFNFCDDGLWKCLCSVLLLNVPHANITTADAVNKLKLGTVRENIRSAGSGT